ncbi:hypothetical protein CVT24_010849 [Panaeolus cyanescens]|uniref:DUF3752 domain-containing protein n=1 Tax=Panaeolus cyanescens TaxID=181874 RepID=A0A409YYF2_9AGAR|nr:hypothetical protein CVT24_010849 [Panaeolus cyanescens]
MSFVGPDIPPHLIQQRSRSESEDDSSKPNDSAPSIGPVIPAHLLSQSQPKTSVNDSEDDDDGPRLPKSIGPSIPAHLLNGSKNDGESDEDDIGPSLPSSSASRSIGPAMPPSTSSGSRNIGPSRPPAGPSMPPPAASSSFSGPQKRTIGPALPTYAPTYDPKAHASLLDDDSDDDIGPKPLPAGMQHQQSDAVKEFLEREEKRKKLAEEAKNPKAVKRDEWMLVPPDASSLLGNLDPSKLQKSRQFSRSSNAAPAGNKDMTLWTETPAERQQRLADEVSGKKRRVTDAPANDEEAAAKRRRKQEEAHIRRGVEEYTKQKRGPSLIDQHSASGKAEDPKDKPIWDHARDMGLGGRLMDDDKRQQMLKEAKGLGDRFGSGSGGGFL